MSTWTYPTTIVAQAYGADAYSCGPYQEGCAVETTTPLPSAPTTGTFLSEPSFVVPGSLLLAILLAFITTAVAMRLKRRSKTIVK
ncbi:MAG TPA: hypothetical protein VFT59_03400 [Candidatus Saccharimonadales bacterium]|nr:hypothetical protein [Candidatus Saccharimonadales bacterium]